MGLIQRLLQALATPASDQGIGPSRDLEDQVHGGLLVESKLEEFRLLVGIHSAPSMQGMRTKQSRLSLATTMLSEKSAPAATGQQLSDSGNSVDHADRQPAPVNHLQRPAENRGIYGIVCNHGMKAKKMYKTFSIMINICLGLQLIVAAALTALGAANGSRSAVTVFGAINTVIAGLMTYLKGSGLPGRFKYFQHEWEKIRDYIEARERDLRINGQAFDVYAEVQFIRQLYQDVMLDIEQNRPDRFVSSGKLHTLQSEGFGGQQGVAQQQQEHIPTNPRPTLARGTSFGVPIAMRSNAIASPSAPGPDDMAGKLQGMLTKFEAFHETLEQKKKAGQDISQGAIERAKDAMNVLQEQVGGFTKHAQAEVSNVRRDAEREMTGLEQKIDSVAQQAENHRDRASAAIEGHMRHGHARAAEATQHIGDQAADLTRDMRNVFENSVRQVHDVQNDIGEASEHVRRRLDDAERNVRADAHDIEVHARAVGRDLIEPEQTGRREGRS